MLINNLNIKNFKKKKTKSSKKKKNQSTFKKFIN